MIFRPLSLAYLAVLVIMAAAPSSVTAQAADALSSIDGEVFVDDAQDRYFNREQCGLEDSGGTGGSGGGGGAAGIGGMGGTAGMGGGGMGGASPSFALKAPSDVPFEVRLNQQTALNDVFLWVGRDGANCQNLEERNQTQTNCAELAGNPRRVDTDFLLTDLVLQDLLDPSAGGSQIVSCESSGLAGTRYQLFVFREAPSSDVAPEMYGIAPFFIDVERPNPPNVGTAPQRQATFTVSWSTPSPTDDIQSWALFFSLQDDPSTVGQEPVATTTQPDARSLSVGASTLGLGDGETGYLFARAYDLAFVNDAFGGNQSDLSQSVPVTAVAVAGYCDVSGDCSGCSAAPMALVGPGATATPWLLSLLFAGVLWWRRRR